MIIRQCGQELLMIRQTDHAALAAELLAAWRVGGLEGRPTREAVLFATREHDVGWTVPDTAPTVDAMTGAPHDFLTAPVAVRQRIWPEGVAALAPTSSYAAALVAQHALTLFRRYEETPEWTAFLARMTAFRDTWFARGDAPGFRPTPIDPPSPERTAFLQDYGFLALADQLSLVFCNAWSGRFEVDLYEIRLDGDRLVIAPDPFQGRGVAFRVPARRLPRTRFGSDEELRAACESAPVVWLDGVARGASASS